MVQYFCPPSVYSSKDITLGLDGWCSPNGESIYEELQKVLEVEVRVVIEQEEEPFYDHDKKKFDINALLDSTLK